MTTEADARARLLAHYEDRLVLLAGRIAALEAIDTSAANLSRRRNVASNLMRARNEIADTREKARRLRETIGKP